MIPRVQGLYDIIQSSKDELEDIRKKCDHPEYEVHWYSWRIGAMNPSRICTECEKPIPGITDEESGKLEETSGLGNPVPTQMFNLKGFISTGARTNGK